MIEIIKRGTKQIIDCGVCGCKFSFDNEDIIYGSTNVSVSGAFIPVVSSYIDCPQCGNSINVKSININDDEEE